MTLALRQCSQKPSRGQGFRDFLRPQSEQQRIEKERDQTNHNHHETDVILCIEANFERAMKKEDVVMEKSDR